MPYRIILLCIFAIMALTQLCHADTLIWSGEVSSLGRATETFPLQQGSSYYYVAVGTVYFGRWYINKRSLVNDACYEFNAKGYNDPLPVLKNSLNIPIANTAYRSDHVYTSEAFMLLQSVSMSFWIEDTDYLDNSGSLRVSLYRVDRTSSTSRPNGTGVSSNPYGAGLSTNPAGAGVSVNTATSSHFAGSFTLTDPKRSYDQFHEQVVFFGNGTGKVKSFMNNRETPISQYSYPQSVDREGYIPMLWSFNSATGIFTVDATCGGRYPRCGFYQGNVKGNTNDFILNGRFANGSAATVRFRRTGY
ncbi:MAG: hypothetical protein AB2L14_11080 [Candidatus Xenobiia bacterium LiM19]